jgi:S-adenosylmethionine:tRNA ribosyltransferase-isomerase
MDVSEFYYDLPTDLIAQHPATERDHSRLMVVDRRMNRITHHVFYEIVPLLRPGDALVVNNTRVIKARLMGRKESGGKVEVLLVELIQRISAEEEVWNCLVRSSKRLHPDTILAFDPDLAGEVVNGQEGTVTIRFRSQRDVRRTLEQIGHVPLPPYIKRKPGPELRTDKDRYQTIFATRDGAIAAPTAGLHFTPSLVDKIGRAGVSIIPLTLHIGIGTFLPIRSARVEDHCMHEEAFDIPPATAEAINSVKEQGGRIIVVGTSATRALESSVDTRGFVVSGHRNTDLFIYPPFRFRVIDALVTNFHLPGSTLLMLVSAFAGKDLIWRAYEEAIKHGYRFYSYGDAMMIM